MSNTLGGTLFGYNCLCNDYCLSEAVASLKALCDKVVLLDAGSDDGTAELMKSFADDKTLVICLPNEEWHRQKGKTKLAYFTNIAINMLSTDWNINLQADEVIHENSFDAIREAIEHPVAESFWNWRLNLWGDSQHYLDVPDNRKPVGDYIIRLAKSNYLSIDDAQSIDAQPACADYVEKIRMYHMGFVRNPYVHTKKIKHMLEEVFQIGNDKKVEAMNGVFNAWGMGFTREDVKPIPEPLPIFVQKWAEKRDKLLLEVCEKQ